MQSVILKKDVLIQDYKIDGLTCVSRSLIHLVPLPFFSDDNRTCAAYRDRSETNDGTFILGLGQSLFSVSVRKILWTSKIFLPFYTLVAAINTCTLCGSIIEPWWVLGQTNELPSSSCRKNAYVRHAELLLLFVLIVSLLQSQTPTSYLSLWMWVKSICKLYCRSSSCGEKLSKDQRH